MLVSASGLWFSGLICLVGRVEEAEKTFKDTIALMEKEIEGTYIFK